MDRITRRDLAREFAYLCEAMGKEIGNGAGQWNLEYYQGWLIAEGLGGRPFGNRRLSAREMYNVMRFAHQAFYLAGKEQD